MIQEIFAQNVRNKREKMGFTRLELANKCGLSLSALQRIEKGTRWPSPDNVEAIAKALAVKSPVLFSAMPDLKVSPREALGVLIEHFNK